MKRKTEKPLAPTWTFLSNHGHVLLCLAKDPEVRLRDIAVLVGITERAVNRIVSELEETGYVRKTKIGRRNQYTVEPDQPLRHPAEAHATVRSILAINRKK